MNSIRKHKKVSMNVKIDDKDEEEAAGKKENYLKFTVVKIT